MKIFKYHGLGNDFIITEYNDAIDFKACAIKYTKRNISVGADGFIVLKKDPFEMVFYNQDGSLAPMCGNGIRCLARYIYENGYCKKKEFDIKTKAGIMKVNITNDDLKNFNVKINMGSPKFDNSMIKGLDDVNYEGLNWKVDGYNLVSYSLFMGTIHTVIFVDNLDEIIKTNVGKIICNSNYFKEKTNVNFVERIDDNNYKIRTYERGVGFTYACGTGACASYVVLNKLNKVKESATMHLTYGSLNISKQGLDIYMEGSATFVYKTEVEDIYA